MVRRVTCRTQGAKFRERHQEALKGPLPTPPPIALHAHEDFCPEYPENCIDVTEEAIQDYLFSTHASNVASRNTYAVAAISDSVMQKAPSGMKQAILSASSEPSTFRL